MENENKEYGESNCLCLRLVTCLLNRTATRKSDDVECEISYIMIWFGG